MKKILLSLILLSGCINLFAQDKPKEVNKAQYILIIRSKTDYSNISKDSIQTNIKHWQAYMGGLVNNGNIVGGYRPGNDGITITSPGKNVNKGAYTVNDEIVSSFLIINAADIDEAKTIAQKCPVFELGGSVEIRPIINTAN